MLIAPFTVQNSLRQPVLPIVSTSSARTEDYLNPYTSDVFTASTPRCPTWAKRTLLVRFMRAMYEANRYLANPGNRGCAIDAIMRVGNFSRAVAQGFYAVATDPVVGETYSPGRNLSLSMQGLINVIDVRRLYGGFRTNVTEGFGIAEALVPGEGELIDYSVLEEAVGSANVSGRADCGGVRVPGGGDGRHDG